MTPSGLGTGWAFFGKIAAVREGSGLGNTRIHTHGVSGPEWVVVPHRRLLLFVSQNRKVGGPLRRNIPPGRRYHMGDSDGGHGNRSLTAAVKFVRTGVLEPSQQAAAPSLSGMEAALVGMGGVSEGGGRADAGMRQWRCRFESSMAVGVR